MNYIKRHTKKDKRNLDQLEHLQEQLDMFICAYEDFNIDRDTIKQTILYFKYEIEKLEE